MNRIRSDKGFLHEHTKKFNRRLKPLILKRDGNRCVLCESKALWRLEIHHIEPLGWKGNLDPEYVLDLNKTTNLVTLCSPCHKEQGRGYNQIRWQKETSGKIPYSQWKEEIVKEEKRIMKKRAKKPLQKTDEDKFGKIRSELKIYLDQLHDELKSLDERIKSPSDEESGDRVQVSDFM